MFGDWGRRNMKGRKEGWEGMEGKGHFYDSIRLFFERVLCTVWKRGSRTLRFILYTICYCYREKK